MLPEQQRILGYFIEEAKDHLNTIEQGLLNLQSTLDDPEMMNEVFRAAHSIKGGAAMLGLSSIQHTAHRLEDCFKVLKNHPVKVDQKLESLFLGVCDTLKALLEHLQQPFGLTEETANTLMSETEPVFKWLHEHLEFLVDQCNTKLRSKTSPPLLGKERGRGEVIPYIDNVTPPKAAPKKSESWQNLQSLQSQVIRTLREMLQLFKQTATPETRQKLQECCHFLAELGEEFNWFNWCRLCHTAEIAIANPKNTYLSLAKIVITDFKNALELVSAGREAEITISQQLQALVRLEEIELLEIPLDLVDNLANTPAQQLELPPTTSSTFNSLVINKVIPQTTNDAASTEVLEIDLQDRITSLSEISEQLNTGLTQNYEKTNRKGRVRAASPSGEGHEEIRVSHSSCVSPINSNDNAPLTDSSTDTNSLEVGTADLNTLADLFESESSDIYGTWDKEETLEINAENKLVINSSNSNTEDTERKFLFNEENLKSANQNTTHLDSDKICTPKTIIKSTQANIEQVTTGRERIQDEVGSLLELLLEENGFLSTGQINQIQTESIPNVELSNNQKTSFDDFKQSEVTRDKNENLTLEELFAETEADNSIALSGNKSASADLFAAMPETDNLSNFWLSEVDERQKDEFYSVDQQDSARELEEILLAAAEEIFDDIEHPLISTSDLNLEDLDLNFQSQQQFDLIFSSEAEDDLFQELSPTHPTTSSIKTTIDINTSIDAESTAYYREVSSTEKSGFSQQPEALQLTPEFTTSSPEATQADLTQASSELNLEFLKVENENTVPVLFEETPTVSSNDVTLFDTTENSFADEQDNFLNSLLFRQPPEGISFTLTSEPSEVQVHLETVDIEAETISQTHDVDFAEVTVVDIEAETIPQTDDVDFAEVTVVDIEAETIPQTDDANLAEVTVVDIEAQTILPVDFDFTDNVQPDSKIDINEDFLAAETTQLPVNTEQIVQNIATNELQAQESTLHINEKNLLNELEGLFEEQQELEDDLSKLLAAIDKDAASVLTATTETIEALSSQEEFSQKMNTSLNEEFAELDKLLELEAISSVSTEYTPEEVTAQAKLPLVVSDEVTSDTAKQDINFRFQELNEMVKGLPPRHPSVSRPARFEQLMKVPVKHLDDLSNLVGELVVNRNTLEQDQERLRQFLDNLLDQVQQLSDVGARMRELYDRSLLEASLLANRRNSRNNTGYNNTGYNNQDTNRGFTELEMDRFTPFHTLSLEMIELIVRVREAASDINFVTEDTEQVARHLRQVTNQLQEGITRSRMESFADVTTPLERGVRESALKCGKQAQLTIEGGDTLIDKVILEHLKSPLTHLLNNAIAHGIETPEVRQAQGKPPVGVITVRAFHQGNQTVISVTDDGAGIDIEQVKAKAIKMGITTPEEAKTLSVLDVYDLLFLPGFSTKEKEDELAGRGIGLDVVRARTSEIRGTINIDSIVGRGTTFTLRLPLTLSICKALCCVSDKARIGFPMDGVEDTLDVPVNIIQQGANGEKYIPWRDTLLPLRSLKEILTFNRQISRSSVYGSHRDEDMISVVVVRSANVLIALQVDQVLNEQEIVIKQFEGPFPKPIGVAGATILGDGRIMPIADVLEIIDIFQGKISKQHSANWEQQDRPVVQETTADKIDPTVLIVDDSITVRELLSLTFHKAGYRVEQARDGQEAWDKLRAGLPCDIVFCDIEMPRCDGLELLSRIQKDPNLNHLPIAMLTSRGADKHRQMAIQLGASGYFTKPYLEEALLEAAGRMLKGEKLVHSTSSP
ncbi:response regulator [Tolypothrix campylonemoides VB511288]|nr:response regulator [Tolypothrix campylonemoides VB511288]